MQLVKDFNWRQSVTPLRGLFELPKIDIGQIRFTNNTPVYADWEYFQRISGGINNIGVGVPLLSLSVGWNPSILSVFQKRTQEKVADIHDICSYSELVTEGSVLFFEKSNSATPFNNLQMEGSNWVPGAVYQGDCTQE